MELRHLRYFIAVAEEGSVTLAAEKRLFTSQPSLSRQLRDLEDEIGTALLERSARGVALTAAGQAFLPHARLVLAQVDAAAEAARRAAQPAKARFALGFLTGQEMDWLPAAMNLLREQLPQLDVSVTSEYSPHLAELLARGKLDAAFMRAEDGTNLAYAAIAREPLIAALPSDHPLAERETLALQDIAAEPFIAMSATAPTLRRLIDDYLSENRIAPHVVQEVDNLAMAMSMIASLRAVAILPAYATNFMPWSVTGKALSGKVPTIDLVLGYNPANRSPILGSFLEKLGKLQRPGVLQNTKGSQITGFPS